MDLDLIVSILLVLALAYVVYKATPMLMVTEPFFVYKSVDPEHRQILPPNPGLGSLEPNLLPLDKQNADMRGPYALRACGKIKGSYPLSSILDSQEDCLMGFSN
jgi:hypothetical protein